eukprot:CAMPEP_0204907894 /NCGR_PEP_ID=MMETSP1397-20131031/6945_1 /ASSEMBLY_ACC=CAM_ASM_000891 /TAXON_ID=49980 /ORGANISM="Climacostomum Climacostomum virens, Strain Stock W-24" /LENGTH=114 /DNA_ID=CAMNT_0052077199 /DNA_START=91 /DNA_END=434 /DNA_ORIENTATION=+
MTAVKLSSNFLVDEYIAEPPKGTMQRTELKVDDCTWSLPLMHFGKYQSRQVSDGEAIDSQDFVNFGYRLKVKEAVHGGTNVVDEDGDVFAFDVFAYTADELIKSIATLIEVPSP